MKNDINYSLFYNKYFEKYTPLSIKQVRFILLRFACINQNRKMKYIQLP